MNKINNINNDFFKYLNSDNEDIDDICLISNLSLEKNYITLPCGHRFNYTPLFNEVKNQKNYSSLETSRIKKNQIKCPYCRTIVNNLLPFHNHGSSEKHSIVDSPWDARKAVRVNRKYGANLIKFTATGGVMSKNTDPNARQFTLDEMIAMSGNISEKRKRYENPY